MVSLQPEHLPAGADGALIAAAHKGDVGAAKQAAEAGASLTAVDSQFGWCALTWAAQEGRLGVVEYLLMVGSDVDAQAPDVGAPADYMLPGNTALMRASKQGHMAVVSALLAAKPDLNAKKVDGATALMLAAGQGGADCVAALLKGGASPEAAADDGSTALLIAAQDGHTPCVEALLRGGADPEAAKSDGFTALLFAAQEGHADCVEALLKRGANVHTQANRGQTALTMSAENGHADCCRLLLLAGADPVYSSAGKSALQWAEEYGHAEIAALLRGSPRMTGLADEAMPAGTRVRLATHGDGVYERFERSRIGANDHFIRFASGLQKVELKKLKPTEWSVLPAEDAQPEPGAGAEGAS